MMITGVLIIVNQTKVSAQCSLKVQLQVTPLTCAKTCDGTATVLNPENLQGLIFLWSNGATTQSVADLCEGPIAVTVWQDANCFFELNSNIDPTVVDVTCFATVPTAPGTITTTVTGGVQPYSYDWYTNPHQYTSSITNLPAGSYFVVVTDANGCSDYTSCDILPEEICGGRTQTMGGWGAEPHGNNPASYLYSHFAAAFPNGAQIGCTNKVILTTPQAVTDFLPSTSTPAKLPAGVWINPGPTINTVLAGQAMALTLSLGFDNNDPNFNPNDDYLGDYVIKNGTFAGMTVSQLLAAANSKLGGCGGPYTLSQLNNALTRVNQNYIGGTVDNGFLSCPKKLKMGSEFSAQSFNYSLNPNPVSDNATLKIISAGNDKVLIDIYNLVGKKVAQLYNNDVKANEEIKININASDLSNGVYIINFHTTEKTYQQKFVVNK